MAVALFLFLFHVSPSLYLSIYLSIYLFTCFAPALHPSLLPSCTCRYVVIQYNTRETINDTLDDEISALMIRELIDWAESDPVIKHCADTEVCAAALTLLACLLLAARPVRPGL